MLLGVSMLVLALDQGTKFLVIQSLELHESVALLPNILYFTYTLNSGTAFGFMANMEKVVRIPFFVTITIAAGSVVYAYQRLTPPEKKLTRVALGLVLGGALGNFVDRLLYGRVVDFIDAGHLDFPFIFNVADSCITVGLLILMAEFLLDQRAKAVS